MENKWFPEGGSSIFSLLFPTARGSPPPVPPDPPDSGLSLEAFPPLSPTDLSAPGSSKSRFTAPQLVVAVDSEMLDSQSITKDPIPPFSFSAKEKTTVENSGSRSTIHFKGFTVLEPKKSSPIQPLVVRRMALLDQQVLLENLRGKNQGFISHILYLKWSTLGLSKKR